MTVNFNFQQDKNLFNSEPNLTGATAHKVEVNADFSDTERPGNIVKGAQKMFTPQLYEQLLTGENECSENKLTEDSDSSDDFLYETPPYSPRKNIETIEEEIPMLKKENIELKSRAEKLNADAHLLALKLTNLKPPIQK